MTEKDIVSLIEKDEWMTRVLHLVKSLNLPDWWIGAGFVRGKIWDTLHDYKTRTPLSDIDVIYLDAKGFSSEALDLIKEKEATYEQKLKKQMPEINWSVTNQARMHLFHDDEPYKTSKEALAQWVETATCVGVRLGTENNIIIAAPRGISDLVSLIVRPTPGANKDLATFNERVQRKEWLKKWPKLKIELQ